MAAPSGRRSGPVTLSLDVGGTGIKGDTLDLRGKPTAEKVRVPTTYPLTPNALLQVFSTISKSLPPCDRVSVGFPGVVRDGMILSAPHFILEGGDGTPEVPDLVRAWDHFNLSAATAKTLGKPTRIGNDAEVQGMAVIKAKGLEVVLTLGTGVGSAVFMDGRLAPHLELAHHPLHKQKTYNEYLGDQVRKRIGEERWNRRVGRMVEVVRALLFFDHLYIGGGNSARVTEELGDDVTLVGNDAGILGGIRLWDQPFVPTHGAKID
jgi:polyphosphate glucokinase